MHLEDYVDLFGLSAADLSGRVLEYGRVSSTTLVLWDGFSQPVTCCAPDLDSTLPFSDFAFDLALCPDYLFRIAPELTSHSCIKSERVKTISSFAQEWEVNLGAILTDEENQSIDFHLQQIMELARVAKDVRIFPLSDSQGLPSPLLGPVLLGLQQDNYGIEVRDVTTCLHPKGSAMLRVWAQQCHVG